MHGMDDPAQARFAWERFRRTLFAMTLVGVVAAIGAACLPGRAYGAPGWFATVATLGGVIRSMAMAGALMGLGSSQNISSRVRQAAVWTGHVDMVG